MQPKKNIYFHAVMSALTGKAWKICRFAWKFGGKNATDTFPGFPWILKSVVNEQSSTESMEIVTRNQLNVQPTNLRKRWKTRKG